MGQISLLFAHKVAYAAFQSEAGAEEKRVELLRSIGVDPDAPVDPKRMIPASDYYQLCEQAAHASPLGASLSLAVGDSMVCDDYGAFGLAWKSAVDLRGSYMRAVRYGEVLTSVSAHELHTEGNKIYMMLHRAGERRLGLRLSNEQTIAAIVKISREVSTQDVVPEAVFFKHPAPERPDKHETYFGCPVHFEADCDAVLVSEETLATPNRLGDATICAFFDAHLETELAERSDRHGLNKRVSIQVSQSLSEGAPSIEIISRRLGMSSRTLQRRLAEQDLSFKQLVDESRRELAQRLLIQSEYSLSEIAFLTGFSEQSAFNRAFKRWAGQTPRSYRLQTRN
ncbi:AraC family transcriptional regulator [Pontiella agarivorans]|uniref:AraC family transcriptional regulator n=1 Tax=Pontiella agarivorans TaxID=3038953 RepID=A0ABU5MTB3_9BACT|nr:AraC family transcriptional regulator [Pontiella agarivorans]MDZ8117444.1 AraC family transcriptional regulator [Pontiella agarivorans]